MHCGKLRLINDGSMGVLSLSHLPGGEAHTSELLFVIHGTLQNSTLLPSTSDARYFLRKI